MVIQSIYVKMAVWYALVLGLIIGILGVSLYSNQKQTVNRDQNKLLRARAEDIREIINSYQEEDKRESEGKNELVDAVKYAVDNNLSDTFLRVFRPDGKEVAHSIDMPPAMIQAAAPQGPSALRNGYFSVHKIVDKGAGVEFKTYTLPVIENDAVTYVIQVSGLLKPISLHLARLKTMLSLFLPLSILLVIVSGLFLTKEALSPVDNMTRMIRQITSKNLRQRIELTGAHDEIYRLAETFNDMLGRLDKTFASQQRLIEDISHELRTPLTALRGKQEIALNKKRSVEEYEAVLNVNLEEINKMSRLVESLLTLAQLEKKQAFLKTRPLDIVPVVERITGELRARAEQKEISLQFLHNPPLFIEADENQIGQVFSNIIDNAIKYTGNKGDIRVIVSSENGFAVVEIRDTGVGIDEEEMPYIFDRFYRADKSRSSSGFGLGLSIAKSIVEAHKGRIEVKSKVSNGTVFSIFLPLA